MNGSVLSLLVFDPKTISLPPSLSLPFSGLEFTSLVKAHTTINYRSFLARVTLRAPLVLPDQMRGSMSKFLSYTGQMFT